MTPEQRIATINQHHKIALNKGYQMIEIEQKISNHYKLNPPPRGYLSITYGQTSIDIFYSPHELPFNKIKDLFVEDFESIVDFTFIKEEFQDFIGVFYYQFKYLDISIDIWVNPSSASGCELKQFTSTETTITTKYQMKC